LSVAPALALDLGTPPEKSEPARLSGPPSASSYYENSSCNVWSGNESGGASMAGTTDGVLLTAADAALKVVEAEAAKAKEHDRAKAAAEAEKNALIQELQKPPGLSPDEKLKRAAAIIDRAIKNGQTEVQVFRFPSEVCTDRGRAINQVEPGWENTLTGIPKDMYQFWYDHLRPLGYKARFQMIDFPGGMPGDIGIFLSWRQRT
jgi:DNA-binding protein H-NS